MADITTILPVDQVSDSRSTINTNFSNLNSDKAEKSSNLSDLTSASTAKTNLGLGNVDNTSDANKPVSTATQTALNLKSDEAKIKRIYKSADETVNNSTTLQNDNELIIPVLANEVWNFTAELYVTSSVTAGMKVGFSVPAGTTMKWQEDDYTWQQIMSESQTEEDGTSGTGVVDCGVYHGVIFVGGTSGNVVLQWAQSVLDATDTKVLQGSHIIAHKLA